MGLKILHSADWHLDSPFGGFSESQRRLLKEEQRKIPGKIADLCLRENCDMLLLSGDLFDAVPSRDTVELVKKTLESTGVPVLIAPGNHDYVQPGSPWLEEDWPENVFIFTNSLESVTVSGMDCRIFGAAFQSMDCPGLLEDFRADGEETYQIAVLHGDPVQTGSPYNPITAAQVRNSGLQYLALGHIHKAGMFRGGDTLCAWPGCPMGRGWDETGDKGVCIVTLGEKTELRPVLLDTLRFHDLAVEVNGDPERSLEAVLPGGGTMDFYRITLTGYGEADLAELKNRFANCPNLELRSQLQQPVDLWEDAGEDTLEGVYFGMLRQLLEENPEHEAQIRLAAEISRKLLDGREVTL